MEEQLHFLEDQTMNFKDIFMVFHAQQTLSRAWTRRLGQLHLDDLLIADVDEAANVWLSDVEYLSADVKKKQSSHELLIAAARCCIALCGGRGKSSRIGKHVTSFASLCVVLKQTYSLDNDELAPLCLQMVEQLQTFLSLVQSLSSMDGSFNEQLMMKQTVFISQT
ncbi:hypothetical protein Dimus_030894 [Dionaea muscipula]